jgi:hypothetical protein
MKKVLFVDLDNSLPKVTQTLLNTQDVEFISIDDHKRTYQNESDTTKELQEYKPFQKKEEKVSKNKRRNNRDSRKSRNINHK